MTGDEAPNPRCGFVAVIGAPNAGKSTLVNTLVGTKVAIVTPKVQTTRMTLRGIAMRGETQIVFVDTPGIFKPRRRLDRAMVKAAWAGAQDADAVLLVVDALELSERPDGLSARDTNAIVDGLKVSRPVSALVLNKVDAMKRERLLPLAENLSGHGLFEQTFMVSAQKGDGLDAVADWCAVHMAPGPWLYAKEDAADVPSRLLAAEMTREQVFLRLHDELPYETAVQGDGWEERKDGSVKIDQTIFVRRDGQKMIVLGKNGRSIKEIGARARAEIEKVLGRRVHLFLHVKVREDWPDSAEHYREWGLEYPKE